MALRGVLNVAAIRAGDVDRDYEAIWTAMTLEMFCRQFIDGAECPDFNADGIGSSENLRVQQELE